MRPWTFLQDTAWAAEVGEGTSQIPALCHLLWLQRPPCLQKNWLQSPKLGALLFRAVGKVVWIFPLDTVDLPEKLSLWFVSCMYFRPLSC